MITERTQNPICLVILAAVATIAIQFAIAPTKQPQRSEYNLFVDKVLADYKKEHKKPIKKANLYHPKSEAERLAIIADIWGIKGKHQETKIFTTRKD